MNRLSALSWVVALGIGAAAPTGASFEPRENALERFIPGVSVPSPLTSVRAYPNPWRSDRHSGNVVTFDQLSQDCTVRIFTVAAQHVKTLHANGQAVTWDLTNETGAGVASGLYLFLVSDSAGQRASGKLAVIR
jgi:hypothetical protein